MPVAIRSLQSLFERHGPKVRQGMRIATPVCALARNDVEYLSWCVFTLDFGIYACVLCGRLITAPAACDAHG